MVEVRAVEMTREELEWYLFDRRYPRSPQEEVAMWAEDKLNFSPKRVKILAPSRRRKVRWRR